MKKLHKLLAIGLFGIFAANCSNDDEDVIPADISNLRAESTPGRIVLRWDTPSNAESIEYIQVNYYDHRSKMEQKRLASIYADSIDIPDTRKRYGDYTFKVKTVSPSGTFGTEQTVTCASEAATATFVRKQIQLTTAGLSSNAPESSEGPIENCIDGETSTFFHTSWSSYIEGPHYLEVDLKQTLNDYFAFSYTTRHNNNVDTPWEIELVGSNGGEWFTLASYSNEDDETILPTEKAQSFESENIKVNVPFNKVRMLVWSTKAYKGSTYHNAYWGPWWAISEFKFWNVEIIDPENPVQDGVDE